MQIPLQLNIDRDARSADLEALIRRRAGKLERFHGRIVGCRVAVERPHRHESSGNPYRVRIEVTVPPQHDLVVTKEPGDHDLDDALSTVIHHAFEAMERRLREVKDRQQGEVKRHPVDAAFVVRLFEDQGYGFLKTEDGREIYFHRNSVADDDFGRLTVGTQVRFEETRGEQGPQATTVQIIDKPGKRSAEPGEDQEVPMGWEP